MADFAYEGVFSDGNSFSLRIPDSDIEEFSNTLLKAYKEDPDTDTEHIHEGIDWEQRKYEIAKDVLAAIYTRPNVKGTLLNFNQIVNVADSLINELKKTTNN